MSGYKRYAVYFTPEKNGQLARFGNAWLGFDPDTGRETERPDCNGLTLGQIKRLTIAPSRYGFHGTLKPPFYLSSGTTPDDVDQAIRMIAGSVSPFAIKRLRINCIGDFLALVPDRSEPLLDQLAQTCVIELDMFRACLSEKDLHRYHSKNLNERQKNLLHQWGYPFVMEEFRFHLTLTGKLEQVQRTRLQRILKTYCMPFLDEDVPFREISLFGDPGNGKRFRLIRRYPLGGDL